MAARSRLQFNGIFVPHVTPFTREGELDEEALRVCVRFWVEEGVSGLVSCGSNGEAPYLSRDERRRVIETVVDEVKGRVKVIAGTGGVSTRETVALTGDAEDLGVDAALVITPFYFNLTEGELYSHYRTLLEESDLPIILYNVPKFTGVNLSPRLISRLTSRYDRLVGVKDSSGSIAWIAEILRLVGEKISVLAGAADVVLPTLMFGGRGAVIAVANVFPKTCILLYEAFKRGDYVEAVKLQRLLSFSNEILVRGHNQVSAIKDALSLKGVPGGFPRKPILPLEGEAKRMVEDLLKTPLLDS